MTGGGAVREPDMNAERKDGSLKPDDFGSGAGAGVRTCNLAGTGIGAEVVTSVIGGVAAAGAATETLATGLTGTGRVGVAGWLAAARGNTVTASSLCGTSSLLISPAAPWTDGATAAGAGRTTRCASGGISNACGAGAATSLFCIGARWVSGAGAGADVSGAAGWARGAGDCS